MIPRGSHRLQFHTQRQAEQVLERDAVVNDFRTDVYVTCADLIEKAHTAGALAALLWNLPREALPKGQIDTVLGGHEFIVAAGITAWLASPELVAEDSVYI